MPKKLKLVGPRDPALKTVSQALDPGEPVPWVKDLLTIVRMSGNGIGIAANQIGITKRMIAVLENGQFVAMANPEITWSSPDTDWGIEGCLSFPKITVPVERPIRVQFRYNLVKAYRVSEEFRTGCYSDLQARCLFHEIDHLNGICKVGEEWERRNGPSENQIRAGL